MIRNSQRKRNEYISLWIQSILNNHVRTHTHTRNKCCEWKSSNQLTFKFNISVRNKQMEKKINRSDQMILRILVIIVDVSRSLTLFWSLYISVAPIYNTHFCIDAFKIEWERIKFVLLGSCPVLLVCVCISREFVFIWKQQKRKKNTHHLNVFWMCVFDSNH